MSFIKDAVNKVKEWWNDIWDGTTLIQNNLTQIIRGVEIVKQASESPITKSITELIPTQYDDIFIKYLARGLEKIRPWLRDARDFNDCLDDEISDTEKLDCIVEVLKSKTDEDDYDLLLDLAASAIKQFLLEELGREVTDEQARKMAQGTYDIKKLAEELKE